MAGNRAHFLDDIDLLLSRGRQDERELGLLLGRLGSRRTAARGRSRRHRDRSRGGYARSEEHTSELQSPCNLVCRLLLEKENISRTGKLVLIVNNKWLKNYVQNDGCNV